MRQSQPAVKRAQKEGQQIVDMALDLADLAAEGLATAIPELAPVYGGVKAAGMLYDKFAKSTGLPTVGGIIHQVGSAIGLI